MEICTWTPYKDEGYYKSDCGHYYDFQPDGKRERAFRWCPYCGKPIRAPGYSPTNQSAPLFGGFIPCQWCGFPVPNNESKYPKCANDRNKPVSSCETCLFSSAFRFWENEPEIYRELLARPITSAEICSGCLDTADVELKIEKGNKYCGQCGRKLSA